ncbi:MAG: hypothetical protein NWQ23_00290 [Yoonia sp.]|uniref:hypothetical protein n=1 Tax=Yoonia sp. TaxID=2212373 RepID=UPI00273EF36F|nr:hypothetical protein [Yoonia sp.]MDP5083824.1 hypothetical protein [Yoonia sp.]
MSCGDPILFNPYSLLPVNPARHPPVKAEAVAQLEEWLEGPRGKEVIGRFTYEGQPLFVHRAVPN